jgi:hypothetical protein
VIVIDGSEQADFAVCPGVRRDDALQVVAIA